MQSLDPSAALRTETRPQHERAEQVFAPARFLSSLGSYRELLQRYLSIYPPVERQLEEAGVENWLPGWKERVKRPSLEADLAAVNRRLGTRSEAIAELPVAPFEEPSEALGALYVIEGSTLGGRVLGQMAKKSLDVTETDGASFFHIYGDSTAASWREVTNLLDGHLNDSESLDAAIESAKSTFKLFERAAGSAHE